MTNRLSIIVQRTFTMHCLCTHVCDVVTASDVNADRICALNFFCKATITVRHLLLEDKGLAVNVLPVRPSLLEHLGDVANHRCLVGGDSLPMHMALGSDTRCVSLFTCTSPWEIYDYGIQTKLISPLLEEFFYQRRNEPRATTAISMTEALGAVLRQLERVPKNSI